MSTGAEYAWSKFEKQAGTKDRVDTAQAWGVVAARSRFRLEVRLAEALACPPVAAPTEGGTRGPTSGTGGATGHRLIDRG